MTISILHTGQTGVERGAFRAARACAVPLAGFCMRHGRDELGTMPAEVRLDLTEIPKVGARCAANAVLEIANAVVIAVPDRTNANAYTGIEALRREIRRLAIPHLVVDGSTEMRDIAIQLRRLEADVTDLRLMVTGPRRTRWADGERLGWQIVSELALADALIGPRKRHVLVVEDDVPTTKAMWTLLRALGHECTTVGDGASALRAAEQAPPDIVFCDIQLPDMSGYEVAQRLRSTQTRPMFLAAITGWEGASDPQQALVAGFDRHVVKPAPAAVLEALLSDADAVLNAAT